MNYSNYRYSKNWRSGSEQFGAEYVYDPCLKKQIDMIGIDDSGFDRVNIIYPPPLKQIESGLYVDEIRCKEGLQLALKNSNYNPVCIKDISVEKLSTRNYISDLYVVGLKHSLPVLN